MKLGRLTLVLLLTSALLVACGGGDDGDTSSVTTDATTETTTTEGAATTADSTTEAKATEQTTDPGDAATVQRNRATKLAGCIGGFGIVPEIEAVDDAVLVQLQVGEDAVNYAIVTDGDSAKAFARNFARDNPNAAVQFSTDDTIVIVYPDGDPSKEALALTDKCVTEATT